MFVHNFARTFWKCIWLIINWQAYGKQQISPEWTRFDIINDVRLEYVNISMALVDGFDTQADVK